MSSGSEYSPSQEELAQAERETSASNQASEAEQREQPSQVTARRCNVPQQDEDIYLDNEHLIRLVQDRVPLCDSRDQQYKDIVMTPQLWNEVAAALMEGWTAPLQLQKGVYEQSPHMLALDEGPLQH
ncbi:uncharacterized protein [Dendrobates tinctorius]|uniref:uncharacterized protein isoform X2 n=1 Tax=Dendrobates tinctorius TaxID=92724 RepID=UPI003CC92C29